MITYPNAKINIGLNICSKRPDGFHNIETVFVPIDLYDALEIHQDTTIDSDFQFTNTGKIINDSVDNNLCIKALRLLKAHYCIPPVSIHLHKYIPFGAGLGGGSADAAFTLKMLNILFNLNIEDNNLSKYAAMLGADCSFFIKNKAAFGKEKGDVLNEIELDLSTYKCMLVFPEIQIATAEAYSLAKPQLPENSLFDAIRKPIEDWKNYIKNDFEEAIFGKYPVLQQIKNKLYENGAVYAAMSGSGSAVFGIFPIDFPEIKNEFLSQWKTFSCKFL